MLVFFLRVNEIFPGLMSLQDPGGKQLGSRVPKRGRDEERKHICVGALHTEQHHMYACAGGDCRHALGDATHPEAPRRPGRRGRTARQSLHRRPGRAARHAAFPEAGLGVSCWT